MSHQELKAYLVCSGLAYEIYSRGGPSTYVYCVVCYRVIVAPYVRSVGHVFANLYNLVDDSECPIDYETYLLPKASHFYTLIKFIKLSLNLPFITSYNICYLQLGLHLEVSLNIGSKIIKNTNLSQGKVLA